MTDMTSPDLGPTNTGLVDLGPFFRRYDRRQRILFGVSLGASLVMSAVIATHVIDTGWTGPEPVVHAVWGVGIVGPTLFTAAWWTFAEFMVRQRRKTASPDGRHPAGPLDARNGMRIANGGFVFNIGLMATALAQQALIAMMVFGYPPVGWPASRIIMFVVGGLTLYLGNLWPKMPAPRTPERAAAVMMNAHRVSGRIMVTAGLLIILFGLFLPLLAPGHRQ
jgi:hypothetical protein